jgi:hypothetical protein
MYSCTLQLQSIVAAPAQNSKVAKVVGGEGHGKRGLRTREGIFDSFALVVTSDQVIRAATKHSCVQGGKPMPCN